MFWLFLSAFVVLVGAELNAEMELQTAKDTTAGPTKPMGDRDAVGASYSVHVMRPAHTHGLAHRADPVGQPSRPAG